MLRFRVWTRKAMTYLRWVKKQIMFIVVPVLISFELEE